MTVRLHSYSRCWQRSGEGEWLYATSNMTALFRACSWQEYKPINTHNWTQASHFYILLSKNSSTVLMHFGNSGFLKAVATYSPVPCPCFWAAGVCIPAAASQAPAHDAAAPSSSGAPKAPVGAWAPVNPVGAGGERGKTIEERKSTGRRWVKDTT